MCETFLNEEKCKENSRELDLDNFTYNRKDRTNKNGGGWIVYFHDYVKYEIRVELESENTESMWFEIFPKYQKSFLLCFIYRPPNSNVSWYQHFDKELTNAFAKNDYVLITGDINIDYLKPLPSNWETILSTYGLDQLVHDPTPVTSRKHGG
jgi:hypothetical protein